MRLADTSLIAVTLLGVCACHPKPLGRVGDLNLGRRAMVVETSLACPTEVGLLKRVTVSADSKSCDYEGANSETVQLSLLDLNGATPQEKLSDLERELGGKAEASTAQLTGTSRADHDRDSGQHEARIDLPGFHLDASGDKANIRLPGVALNADGGSAHITTGSDGGGQTIVSATPGGAEIHTSKVGRGGSEFVYLLASDTPSPTGDRVVGYEAKGPTAGPLVVGVFRARDHQHGDTLRNDGLRRLIDMNVYR